MKRTLMLVRGMNKAIAEATEEKNSGLQKALKAAHSTLSDYLDGQGVRPPKPRKPRGRRPRS